MNLINFLKKIVGKHRTKDSKIEERITFNEVGVWIENKRNEIKDKEKEIFVLIKNRTTIVLEELNGKIKVLEGVDLGSKKAEDKIKLIVKENLNNYVDHIKEFIIYMGDLKEEELDKIIYRINNIFSDFDKKSYINYQKATFLIGKEMATVKESTINLSKYFKKVFDKNKDIIDSSKMLSFIKLKLKQIDETNEIIHRTDERIKTLDSKITSTKEKNKKILDIIEKIKRSESYIENLNKQEKIKLGEKELEKEIYKLKEMIDFKALGNIFHINKKEMGIIKAHKEGFQTTLQKDSGASILNLLDGAKLNNETITSKIKQINSKKEEMTKIISSIKKDETEELLVEMKKIKLEIEKLNNEKEKELKVHKKLKTKREEVIDLIKQKLNELNVIISGD